jgi:peroxiredoxin
LCADPRNSARAHRAVRQRGRVFVWVFSGVLAVLLGVLAWSAGPANRTPAPDVRLTSLTGLSTRLSALEGQVVVLNFWATTCAPCVTEMPQLAALYRSHATRGLAIWAVAMSYDRPDLVVDFTRRFGLPFPVALDLDGGIVRAFEPVDAVPTTVLIDRDGHVVRRYVGAIDFADLTPRIEAALGG